MWRSSLSKKIWAKQVMEALTIRMKASKAPVGLPFGHASGALHEIMDGIIQKSLLDSQATMRAEITKGIQSAFTDMLTYLTVQVGENGTLTLNKDGWKEVYSIDLHRLYESYAKRFDALDEPSQAKKYRDVCAALHKLEKNAKITALLKGDEQ